MQLPLFQVDAFSDKIFSGNPAAVVPLESWLDDDVLQRIAEENNLSETAFIVAEEGHFALRWFTPMAEVDLCGHATLAAAHVLYCHLGVSTGEIHFSTRSGRLSVTRCGSGYALDFPGCRARPVTAPQTLFDALPVTPLEIWAEQDYLLLLADEAQLRALQPDFSLLAQLDRRGVIVTAAADSGDFVCRCFYPKLRINEDPVTGSAFCQLLPFWAPRLGKNTLLGRQLSARGGSIEGVLDGDRVRLVGQAADYLRGVINIP